MLIYNTLKSYYIFKLVITGIIVVIITEIAKFNLKLAALITMPIVTLLCIFWMYYEGMEKKKYLNMYLVL